jgi:hypothetical protein
VDICDDIPTVTLSNTDVGALAEEISMLKLHQTEARMHLGVEIPIIRADQTPRSPVSEGGYGPVSPGGTPRTIESSSPDEVDVESLPMALHHPSGIYDPGEAIVRIPGMSERRLKMGRPRIQSEEVPLGLRAMTVMG